MKSLFLKVFLWFWLATALAGGALLVVTEATRPDINPDARRGRDGMLAMYGRVGVETLERNGQAAAREILEEAEREGGNIRAYILDDRGEILGRMPPIEMSELAARARQSNAIERQPTERGLLVAIPGSTRDGRRFATVGQIIFQRPTHFAGDPLSLVLRLAAVLLVTGVLCYWLARYIVSPVVKLRAATQQIAGGDLTARVGQSIGKRRDELGGLGRDFDVMTGRLETSMNAQRRLLSDISHELRSPLARLGVALDLARKRCDSETNVALDRIGREAEKINEMIGQLLTLTRWENGADEFNREPVDLARLVETVAADADFEAQSRNRTVRATQLEDCRTHGNPALLQSAIENVVRNAVHYTAEGTTVNVSLRRQTEEAGDYAVISVRDAGRGVPEEMLADIFRPFYRVEDARDRESGGVGLGLAITKRAIELHGGSVRAANAPEGGFVVEIHLPASSQNRLR